MPTLRWEPKRGASRTYKSEKPVLVPALVFRAQPASTNTTPWNTSGRLACRLPGMIARAAERAGSSATQLDLHRRKPQRSRGGAGVRERQGMYEDQCAAAASRGPSRIGSPSNPPGSAGCAAS